MPHIFVLWSKKRKKNKKKKSMSKMFKCKTIVLCNHDKLISFSVFRLWAEVFHVSASGAGTVKWQQVSEDLVPVNITCIQDSPECVFHITAYNSQVDKILDVRLVQPGKFSQLPFQYSQKKNTVVIFALYRVRVPEVSMICDFISIRVSVHTIQCR